MQMDDVSGEATAENAARARLREALAEVAAECAGDQGWWCEDGRLRDGRSGREGDGEVEKSLEFHVECWFGGRLVGG